jgi:creatinine amidohydrolase
MRPYVLAETNWAAVKETDFEVAVLPWGATEPHNFHLPYGTDNIQAEYIGQESARLAWESGARVIVLPGIPFGVNTGQLDLKLVVNMMPTTQLQILLDIAKSLTANGINKLVILNGHGGNDFKAIVRELQGKIPECFVCVANWYTMLPNDKFFDEPGDHAGEMETSNVMHITPDLVAPLDTAGDGSAKSFSIEGLKNGLAWAPRTWTKVTNDTGVGDPEHATPTKGETFLTEVTQTFSAFLQDLCRADVDNLYE